VVIYAGVYYHLREVPDNKLILTRDFCFIPSEVCQSG
jgi:hypothetical protein